MSMELRRVGPRGPRPTPSGKLGKGGAVLAGGAVGRLAEGDLQRRSLEGRLAERRSRATPMPRLGRASGPPCALLPAPPASVSGPCPDPASATAANLRSSCSGLLGESGRGSSPRGTCFGSARTCGGCQTTRERPHTHYPTLKPALSKQADYYTPGMGPMSILFNFNQSRN